MLDLLTFVLINLLGVISPGPDFAIVSRYALSGKRAASLWACLGIATALIVHAFVCVLGLAVILQKSPLLMKGIQMAGSVYLFYLGLQAVQITNGLVTNESSYAANAFWKGFFTNLLNAKATIFLWSLFAQFLNSSMSWQLKLIYGASVPLISLLWFASLAWLLTHSAFMPFISRYQRIITQIMGAFLILLSFLMFWHIFPL